MADYLEIRLHRGIVTPGGSDIKLLGESLYNYSRYGINYDFGLLLKPKRENSNAVEAHVLSWHNGPGSDPDMGKIGEAYFPEGIETGKPGIILVKDIVSRTKEKTFEKNKDLIDCLLNHHERFFEKNPDLIKTLKKTNARSILVGKILQ